MPITRTNDHSIRTLAVYTILKRTNKDNPIKAKQILKELDKQYHITTTISTVRMDIDAVALFEDVKSKTGVGYWIEGGAPIIKPGNKFYSVYYNDDKKEYAIEGQTAEEVSDQRVWVDGGACEIMLEDFGVTEFLNFDDALQACERANKELRYKEGKANVHI